MAEQKAIKRKQNSSRNNHFADIMAELNDHRHRKNYCDKVTLVVQGKAFSAHRSVLAAASPYFDNMFNSNMKEKHQGSVRLEKLPASVMESILEFIYTGDVQFADGVNVRDLVASADYLILSSLKTHAFTFLVQNLSVSNCISSYYEFLAEKYECQDLLQSIREFINRNFVSVSKSESFLALSLDQVKEWTASDDIIINAEEDVYQVVLTWVGHDGSCVRENHFEELFQNVRLTSVTLDYFLTDIMNNRLVTGNTRCHDLALDALKHITRYSGNNAPWKTPRKCLVKHVEGIVALEGRSTRCYDPSTRLWYQLASMGHLPPSYSEEYHGLSSCRGCMFVTKSGSHGRHSEFGITGQRYNPLNGKWSVIGSLPKEPFLYGTVVTWRGFVYVIGLQTRTNIGAVFRYDPEFDSWKEETSLSSPRRSVCAVADDDYIYAIGGNIKVDSPLDVVETYHPRTGTWTPLPPMTRRRSAACGVLLGGKIFVVGGLTNSAAGKSIVSKTCEMYHCATQQWQVISSVQFPRYHGSAVALGGAIYVVGGWKKATTNAREDSIELYDPQNDKWKREATMPSSDGSPTLPVKACALRVNKALLVQLAPP